METGVHVRAAQSGQWSPDIEVRAYILVIGQECLGHLFEFGNAETPPLRAHGALACAGCGVLELRTCTDVHVGHHLLSAVARWLVREHALDPSHLRLRRLGFVA